MESELYRAEIRAEIRALFGPERPSLRAYLGLLLSRAWKRRWSFIRDSILMLFATIATTVWQVRRGIVAGERAADIVKMTVIPVFIIILIYLLLEFVRSAYRTHKLQARHLAMKQATIARQNAERVGEVQTARESAAWREAVLRERSRQREEELIAAIARLRKPPPHPKEHLRAKVRAKVVKLLYLEIENVGELEARRVRVVPIEDDGYPWSIQVAEIGALTAGVGHERAVTTIRQRDGVTCEDCAGAPRALGNFLDEATRHSEHELRQRHARGDEPTMAETHLLLAAAFDSFERTIPLLIQYEDELGRKCAVSYRMEITLAKDQTPEVRLVWDSESEPVAAATSHAIW